MHKFFSDYIMKYNTAVKMSKPEPHETKMDLRYMMLKKNSKLEIIQHKIILYIIFYEVQK